MNTVNFRMRRASLACAHLARLRAAHARSASVVFGASSSSETPSSARAARANSSAAMPEADATKTTNDGDLDARATAARDRVNGGGVNESVDYEDLSDRLKLDNVRQSLIRQEDSIIFALIERAQYKLNSAIYAKNAVPVPCFAPNGDRASMLEFMLREVEQSHGKIRRYTSPDEHAFYPEAQPPLVIPPIAFKDVLHPCAESININDRIMEMYVDNLLPEM